MNTPKRIGGLPLRQTTSSLCALIGERVDPMTGKVAPLRIVLRIVDRDRFNVEWHMRQGDGTEQRTVLMEHVRRAAAR